MYLPIFKPLESKYALYPKIENISGTLSYDILVWHHTMTSPLSELESKMDPIIELGGNWVLCSSLKSHRMLMNWNMSRTIFQVEFEYELRLALKGF